MGGAVVDTKRSLKLYRTKIILPPHMTYDEGMMISVIEHLLCLLNKS